MSPLKDCVLLDAVKSPFVEQNLLLLAQNTVISLQEVRTFERTLYNSPSSRVMAQTRKSVLRWYSMVWKSDYWKRSFEKEVYTLPYIAKRSLLIRLDSCTVRCDECAWSVVSMHLENGYGIDGGLGDGSILEVSTEQQKLMAIYLHLHGFIPFQNVCGNWFSRVGGICTTYACKSA